MNPHISIDHPPRVLVIGAGATTNLFHLPVLAKLRDRGRLTLSVVCDIRTERAAAARKAFGFRESCGEALSALARPDIDIVYVFGSAQIHARYGMAALEHGKHLFVEKPVAPSFAEAREVAGAARERNLIAVGGHNRRFYKSIAAVRARAGAARWRYAEAVFHKPEFGKPPMFGARSWLSANGIHALDALVFAMDGLPDELTAFAGDGDTFSAVMRWRCGAQGAFLCNNSAGTRRETYSFHGPGETLTISDTGLTIEQNGTRTRTPFPAAGDGIAEEHEAFLEAIAAGEEPVHSIASLAPSLFLVELIESGYSGRVRLPTTTVHQPCAVAAKSVLLVKPEGLEEALARVMPDCRFLTIEDVQRASTGARHDIHAAIIGGGGRGLPEDILDRLPNLSIVGIAALSLSRYDPEALLARGVTVANASAAYADSVAEFALGLAILGRRRAFMSDTVMRRGGWGTGQELPGVRGGVLRAVRGLRPILRKAGLESSLLTGWRKAKPFVGVPDAQVSTARDLRGATVGLIGWGANARAFTSLLIHVGARVAVYSEHASAEDIRAAGAEPASLGAVLASDIVSLHRGLTPGTRHSLDAAALDKLRPGAVLINVARGALIEPNALAARLKRGDIFACLDTFEEEPLPASHPLRKLSNVFLTSHIAGGSRDMHRAAAEEVVQKVAAYLEGGRIEPVTRERLSTMS
jgi:phosphoglycerate dehydrogenase-like enzyme/predicted dehydrogenase